MDIANYKGITQKKNPLFYVCVCTMSSEQNILTTMVNSTDLSSKNKKKQYKLYRHSFILINNMTHVYLEHILERFNIYMQTMDEN